MKTPSIVFVHGAAGAQPLDAWLEPLNAALRAIDQPTLGAAERCICVDYAKPLQNPESDGSAARTGDRFG